MLLYYYLVENCFFYVHEMEHCVIVRVPLSD